MPPPSTDAKGRNMRSYTFGLARVGRVNGALGMGQPVGCAAILKPENRIKLTFSFTHNPLKPMDANKLFRILTAALVGVATLGFLAVAIQAFINPQLVMDLVQTHLPNADARSSIRGLYGGVNVGLSALLVLGLIRRQPRLSLWLLFAITGGYVVGRVANLMDDGPAGPFASTWLIIETFFFLGSGALLFWSRRFVPATAH